MPSIDVVQDLPPRVQYTSGNLQTVFPYPFPIFNDVDLVVVDGVDGPVLTLGVDYTVSGAGDDTGGDVTFAVGRSLNAIITIYRDIPADRDTDVPQNGDWSSVAYNNELDKVILLIQQLKMLLARTVRFSLTSTVSDADLEINTPDELTGILSTLDSLSDVQVPTPNDQDILSWDDNIQQWVARAQGSVTPTSEESKSVELRGATFTAGVAAINASTVNDVPIYIKQECNITKIVVLTRSGLGSCVLDIWKKPFTNFPPSVADSIMGPSKPTISSGRTYIDTTLTGVNRFLSAGDTLIVHLQSSSNFEVVGIFIELTPIDVLPNDEATDDRIRQIVLDVLAEGGGAVVVGDTITITQIGNVQDLKLWDAAGRPTGVVTFNYTLPASSNAQALSTKSYALDFRGFNVGSVINFSCPGRALARGGDGADGGAIVVGNGSDNDDLYYGAYLIGERGQPGGTAIIGPGAGVEFNVDVSEGIIAGGGGGGGGGGATANRGPNTSNGGGGGGGAGGGKAGRGGRAGGNSPGSGGGLGNGGAQANDGIDGGTGADGTFGTGGTGNGAIAGGTGGDGGDWGTNGSAGAAPTSGTYDTASGTGGLAGKAIDLNGGTINWIGVHGPTHVKGAVS
jgi:hypothetical protein